MPTVWKANDRSGDIAAGRMVKWLETNSSLAPNHIAFRIGATLELWGVRVVLWGPMLGAFSWLSAWVSGTPDFVTDYRFYLLAATYAVVVLFWYRFWSGKMGRLKALRTALSRSTHFEATRSVLDRVERGERFLLYLRSYRVEITSVDTGDIILGGPLDFFGEVHLGFPRDFEAELADEAARRGHKVVGVRNRFDAQPSPQVPRLEMFGPGWEQPVQDLISLADSVVVFVDCLNAGVLSEIRWLTDERCPTAFVLVCSPRVAKEHILADIPGLDGHPVFSYECRDQAWTSLWAR